MGFFDSFKDSFKKSMETANNNEREKLKRNDRYYRTVVQEDREFYKSLNCQSDSSLMNKYRSSYTSDDEKSIIITILRRRGYTYRGNGSFGK